MILSVWLYWVLSVFEMPLRSDHNTTTNNNNNHHQQVQVDCPPHPQACLPLPRRSNSVSSGSITSSDAPTRSTRQKRHRCGSGTTTSPNPFDQPPARKSRRHRSGTASALESLIVEPNPAAKQEVQPAVLCNTSFLRDAVPASPSKLFSDQNDSDSNSCMDDLKTVVEVASVQGDDVVDQEDRNSSADTPNSGSNDEGTTSEGEDETVAKLPPTSSFEGTPADDASSYNDRQPGIAFPITPVVGQRSNSCDACPHSASSSSGPSRPSDESPRVFRQQVSVPAEAPSSGTSHAHTLLQKPSLSSFSSAASLVSTIMEPGEASGSSTPLPDPRQQGHPLINLDDFALIRAADQPSKSTEEVVLPEFGKANPAPGTLREYIF